MINIEIIIVLSISLFVLCVAYLFKLNMQNKNGALLLQQNLLDGIYSALNKQQLTLQESLSILMSQVDKHMIFGVDKTTTTVQDINKRLVLIDAAQQNLINLSKDVIKLQDILKDKKTRGVFGETQLGLLIANLFPAANYALQYQLSNGLRCDCILFLPDPIGHIVIDSKFPLENYQRFVDVELDAQSKVIARRNFVQDIKKHINDIAMKYIVVNETANGALMFVPAESIFAEIHENHSELVDYSYQNNVWIASPTTLMAILTVALNVLKQTKTKENIDLIQSQLKCLAEDFSRLNERIDKLTKNLNIVLAEADKVNISTKKITQRFEQIVNIETIE